MKIIISNSNINSGSFCNYSSDAAHKNFYFNMIRMKYISMINFKFLKFCSGCLHFVLYPAIFPLLCN